MSGLHLVPVTIAQADAFVDRFHRHNDPAQRARFAVGVADDTGLVRGVAVAGNPKARMLSDGATIEVVRCCTDGAPNACSMLYRACARAAKAMGFLRVITYTLDAETGASLRAAGFVSVHRTRSRSVATTWHRGRDVKLAGRPDCARTEEHAELVKARWELWFTGEPLDLTWPDGLFIDGPTLWDAAS